MTYKLPKTMEIETSSMKSWAMLSICLVFTLWGVWMLSNGEGKFSDWVAVIFFGVVGLPVCIVRFVKQGKLILTNEGFEQILMGRTMKCNWEDVSDFDVIGTNWNKFVSFSRVEDEGKAMALVSKALTGNHSGMLGDNFGLRAEELAELMNAFRNRALGL